MTKDNSTGKPKDFYARGQQMFDSLNLPDDDDDTQVYKKPWVGLTDKEIWETVSRIGTSDSDINPYAKLADARAIEAKLKERNT